MTATLPDMAAKKKQGQESAEQQAALELVRLAKEQGLSEGLLKQPTKTVLESALNEEMTQHLGYEKRDPVAPGPGTFVTAPARRRCCQRISGVTSTMTAPPMVWLMGLWPIELAEGSSSRSDVDEVRQGDHGDSVGLRLDRVRLVGGELAGCNPKTITRYVLKRGAGGDPFVVGRRARLVDPFLDKIEELADRSEGEIRADVLHLRLTAMGLRRG